MNNDPLVVTVNGEKWSGSELEQFERQLAPAYHHANVIVDLSSVEHLDSDLLAAFIRKRRHRHKKGWEPSRIVLTRQVRELFTEAGFDKIYPIFETVNKARWDAS
jgi:anti-anti-sigma regulatory factor